MNKDNLVKKLQYYVDNGNIDRQRCVEIGKQADAAISQHSRDRKDSQLARAMLQCCGGNQDEAAFFRASVNFTLQYKWGANERDSAVIVTTMDATYQKLLRGQPLRELEEMERMIAEGNYASNGRTKSSGCLIILGFVGVLATGLFAAHEFWV